MRLDLLVYNSLWITYNQSIHQYSVAGMLSDFFQEQADRGLFYWHNHGGKTQLPKPEENILLHQLFFVNSIFINCVLTILRR